MEERFYYLVKKRLTGNASDQELEELDGLLVKDEELNAIYKILFAGNSSSSIDDIDAQQAYAAHFVKMQLSNQFEDTDNGLQNVAVLKNRRRFSRILVAASVTLLFTVGAGLFFFSSWFNTKKVPGTNEIVTNKGSKSNIVLPDGTKVWLNADSKLTYQDDFNSELRIVNLTGEAYFDVTPNKKKPFIIHTSEMDIKVLGTAFNVRAYPGEKTVETSLVRGMIEVTLKDQSSKKIILKEKEKIVVTRDVVIDSALYTIDKRDMSEQRDIPILTISKMDYQQSDSSSIETMWVKNKLAFQSERLEMIAMELERWYGQKVVIENSKLKSLRFTGVFKDKTLNDVLMTLQLTQSGFHFREENGMVIIY